VRQPNGSWAAGAREAEYERLTTAVSAAFDEAFTELERTEYNVDLRNGLGICELHFDRPTTAACCGIATNHIVIQDDGRLASCPMTTRQDAVAPSADLFTAAPLTFLHRPEDRNTQEEQNCLDCQWFPVCTSGCPVTNLRIKGSAFTISPLHAFYAFVIPRYIVFVGRKLLQKARRQGVGDFVILDVDHSKGAIQ
jgi:radical SAM protein with 4Fe4S-binding SPASM domain